ncbi:hypothetical protein [Pseudanabaena sp. FACHB-2040]|uniref:hypothetical protein n=1 Tax=Pseudanabaena sp. FACHB-2040 TaxID=2692859 RepID=UPI0016846B10|nr:hypothetical protein [Pseudanabaena sp. FACHB-2040]MBD2259661.1 hypothetical protein [Pseudanabaena sp. FACHB-2040]
MTGFIRGLFGGNGKKKEEQRPLTPQEKAAYFLDADDAKSYGNIEYMRTSKTVRRTFARKKGVAEELASVKQISAMQMQRLLEDGSPEITLNGQSNGSAAPKQEQSKRQLDSSMDMFRNMARDMKK